jgi:uncharacterized protein involved in exopolysaccharide biosynthesis
VLSGHGQRIESPPVAEGEIDVRRYWSAVAARWWLPVVGLLAGAAIGYALSLGGSDVWRGTALVYLGQPVTPSGAQVQSLGTNPAAAGEIAGSTAAQRRVERQVGMRRGALAGRVSVAAVKGNVSRLGQNPLVRLRVEGETRKVGVAATALARIVVREVSDYADEKIAVLEDAIQRLEQDLDEAGSRGADTNVLLWRAELTKQLLDAQLTLKLAENIERARVVEEAIARKVTAQSRRNRIVVGALLGLLLGLAAALLAESAGVLRRR